jgi:hypothetical protein
MTNLRDTSFASFADVVREAQQPLEAVGEREMFRAELTRRELACEEYWQHTDRRIPVVLLRPTDANYHSGA